MKPTITRRDCIKLGLGSLFGGSFIGALKARAASTGAGPTPTAKSCILIWMDGGPTHYETFDPKPDAPAEIRGAGGELVLAQPHPGYSYETE